MTTYKEKIKEWFDKHPEEDVCRCYEDGTIERVIPGEGMVVSRMKFGVINRKFEWISGCKEINGGMYTEAV